MAIRCGEIWMVELPSNDGSLQSGYRPVFVISNDKNNTFSPNINIIPLSSKMSKKNLPCHVKLEKYEKYGLSRPSIMLVEQITTVPAEALKKRIGYIDDEEITQQIICAISVQFPIIQMAIA